MTSILRSVVLALALGAPVAAQAAVIDFDSLDSSAAQTMPLGVFSEDGFTFGLAWDSRTRGAAIFDTTCVGYGGGDGCNGDADLRPAGGQGSDGVAGNVLIRQENRSGAPTPNDEARGGRITFTLLGGKSFVWRGFSAVDDGRFTARDGAGTVLGEILLTGEGETGSSIFASSRIRVGDTFSVAYSGSGGIDSLVLAPVPLPASLPLAAAGLGLLGWLGRRRAA